MIMTQFVVEKNVGEYGFNVIDTKTGAMRIRFKRKYQANAEAFRLNMSTMKTVTNLMTGEEMEIPVGTPRSCDPSTETYWSM